MGTPLLPIGGTTDRLANAFLEVAIQQRAQAPGVQFRYTVPAGVCLVITDGDFWYGGGGSSPQLNFVWGPTSSTGVFASYAPSSGTAATFHWTGYQVIATGQQFGFDIGGSAGANWDVRVSGMLVPQPFQFA